MKKYRIANIIVTSCIVIMIAIIAYGKLTDCSPNDALYMECLN